MKKTIAIILFLYLLFPISIFAEELNIYSQNMVLYQLNEDKIINEKNKDEQISVASLTKIMTAYVAIQHIQNLDDQVTLTSEVFKGLAEANAAVVGFKRGETVTYKDLLYGTLLASGADAAQALAIFTAGNLNTFMKWMNEEAQKLGMQHTHFTNTIGLDNNQHYSSVNDIAILLKKALQNKTFYEIFTSSSYTTNNQRLHFSSTLQSTMQRYHLHGDYILGAKTGFTYDAGRCLASIAYDEDEDITYLLVTAKAPTTTNYYHIMDAIQIYEYYFEHYGYQKIVNKKDTLVTLNTKNSNLKHISITASEDILYYLNNDYNKEDIQLTYDGITTVSSKNHVGDKLGKITVYYKEKMITTIPIILNQKIPFSIKVYLQNHLEIIGIIMGLLFIGLCVYHIKKQ